jgi:hypothetical protein
MPIPSQITTLQSPGIWLLIGVPWGVKVFPHWPAVQVRDWQSSSMPGQSCDVVQPAIVPPVPPVPPVAIPPVPPVPPPLLELAIPLLELAIPLLELAIPLLELAIPLLELLVPSPPVPAPPPPHPAPRLPMSPSAAIHPKRLRVIM